MAQPGNRDDGPGAGQNLRYLLIRLMRGSTSTYSRAFRQPLRPRLFVRGGGRPMAANVDAAIGQQIELLPAGSRPVLIVAGGGVQNTR